MPLYRITERESFRFLRAQAAGPSGGRGPLARRGPTAPGRREGGAHALDSPKMQRSLTRLGGFLEARVRPGPTAPCVHLTGRGLARAAILPWSLLLLFWLAGAGPGAAAADGLLVGAARREITPPPGLPLWGYGVRKDAPALGTNDPLTATAVVFRVGAERVAVVGLDLGRSPPRATNRWIRETLRARAGFDHVLLVGSHTHHGPCLELEDQALEAHRATADYMVDLRSRLVEAILEADGAARPAVMAVGHDDVAWNRNRHSKIEPKPVDRRMTVVRVDGVDGAGIALLVNYAAHPTTRNAIDLRWSADFPAALRARVEREKNRGLCVFLQGACGDLSPDRKGLETEPYGEKLGEEALRIAGGLSPRAPASPSLRWSEEELKFSSRIQLSDPLTYFKYCAAFFKDLVDAYVREYREGIRPGLHLAVLNGELGLVGVSGELFSAHAIRLRERAARDHLPQLLVLGYTNGYHQYFPTIEATFEGGYGADPEVSPVEAGAGERMMDRALIHLHELRQ